MRVLHFYPKNNEMAAQYVEMLREATGSRADMRAECQFAAFKKAVKDLQPDIVHLHGCWRWANTRAMDYAAKRGIRTVYSPHGGLEPWVVRQHFWKDKLPKLLLYQRRTVRGAFALVAMGRMEADSLRRSGLNPRIETVRNALVTSTITPQQMAESILAIYRKVLASFPFPLMSETTTMALRAFIKAGQTDDARWLSNEEYQATQHLGPEAWRQLLMYAHQEGISDTVERGILTAGQEMPADIHPETVSFYTPPRRQKKAAALDTHGSDDLERLSHALHSAHKLMGGRHLTLAHVVGLCSLIRESQADEERLAYRLRTQSLQPFACRMMSVLEELTGLEEGLMPVEKLSDKKARRMLSRVTNHNEIL